jgi:hypothetical protein
MIFKLYKYCFIQFLQGIKGFIPQRGKYSGVYDFYSIFNMGFIFNIPNSGYKRLSRILYYPESCSEVFISKGVTCQYFGITFHHVPSLIFK